MAFPKPKFSRTQVNRAGRILLEQFHDLQEQNWAYEVVSNWKACHGYPVNTFQATLRNRLKEIDSSAIVAQRLKRTPSIIGKLARFPSMQLARMQDIGGLRAVVKTPKEVSRLVTNYEETNFQHELVTKNDYIANPKESGYRSVHLIYRYKNKRAPEYDGLLIELQFRSKIQHAWATAVETMGTFLEQALKASRGSEVWLDFFKLAGAGFAIVEKCPPVPGFEDLSDQEIFAKIQKESEELDIRTQLLAFKQALRFIDTKGKSHSYHLLVLRLDEKLMNIQSYARGDLEKATNDYAEQEKRLAKGENIQTVLVSAGPMKDLKRAYPNYFFDTDEFIRQLDRIKRRVQ